MLPLMTKKLQVQEKYSCKKWELFIKGKCWSFNYIENCGVELNKYSNVKNLKQTRKTCGIKEKNVYFPF
jgi:hypothetical protein